MARKLVLCLDGTWNTVKDHTNVSRIHAAIRNVPSSRDGNTQVKYYDEGVGTHWYDHVRGGVLGWGLPKNIREAYTWLIEQYQDKNEIFLFGFSRGAFTARSLGGLIGRCGVPRMPAGGEKEALKNLVKEAYKIYRSSKEPNEESEEFIKKKSRRVQIKFIGVWDTVGALGVPGVNLIENTFHDTKLGKNVEYAFHALAIDEHRKSYSATLWTANPGNARMEQRWFPGAHSNVGGGYEDDLLPDISLAWIANRARECGLFIDDELVRLDGNEYRYPVRDSFKEFGFGVYRVVKLGRRYYRPIGQGLNEAVDPSAQKKWAANPRYRPENLAHAGATVTWPNVRSVAPAG